jgi:AraC family transcriptional regulator
MTARLSTAIEHRRRIRRGVEYLDLRLRERPDHWPTLSMLSEVACLSPFHFIRLYRHAVGETPQATVRRIKLQAAQRRLRLHPQEPIAELALAHGYDSAAAFTRAYRQQFGAAPSRSPATAGAPAVVTWTASLPPIAMQSIGLPRGPGAVGAAFDELMGHLDVAGVPRFGQDMLCEMTPHGEYRRACAVENPWVADTLKLSRRQYGNGLHRCLSGQPDAVWKRWREDEDHARQAHDRPLLLRYLNDPAYRTRDEQRIELYVPLLAAPA